MQARVLGPLRLRPRRPADRDRRDGPLPRGDDAQPGGPRPGRARRAGELLDRLRASASWSGACSRCSSPRAGSRSASSPPPRCCSSPLRRALPRARATRRWAQPAEEVEAEPRARRRGQLRPGTVAAVVRLRADPRRRPAAGRRAARPRRSADRVRVPGPAALPRPRDAGRLRGDRRGRVRPTPSSTRTLGTIGLVLILFEGGLTAGWNEIRPVLGTAVSLATIGTVITAVITGLAAVWLFDLSTARGPDDRLGGGRHRQRRDLRRPARLAPAQAGSRARSRASRG